MDEEEIQNMIRKYTSLGWELAGGFYLGDNNFNKFLTFVWDKDTEPVDPK